MENRVAWRCTVCGYIETGYPEGLPEDYVCPECGVGPDMFEKVLIDETEEVIEVVEEA